MLIFKHHNAQQFFGARVVMLIFLLKKVTFLGKKNTNPPKDGFVFSTFIKNLLFLTNDAYKKLGLES